MTSLPEAPPRIPGTLTPTVLDQVRIVWWHEQGFIRASSRGTWRERARAATLAFLWWPSLGVVLAVQLWRSATPNRTAYLSPTRDGVLAVVAKPGGLWVIEDHIRKHQRPPKGKKDPMAGNGGALTAQVVAALLPHIDERRITVEAVAADEKLAELYMAALPGLEIVGPAPKGRGILLRRLPRLPDSGDQ